MSRVLRALAWTAGLLLLVGIGACVALRNLGAASKHAPAEFAAQASPAAQTLVAAAFEGLDPARVLDLHVHLAGLGTDASGCRVDPRVFSWWHPVKRVQFLFYLDAAGVQGREHADRQLVERLVERASDSPVPIRCALLAFDHARTPTGEIDEPQSELYVPNEWAVRIAAEHPQLFVPVISVHPWRADALAELERWAAQGVRLVKWLPNSMNIDPADPRCDAFYECLARHDMTLLVHTGEERAVDSAELQELGNPLKLRRALALGVRVVAAHCGSLGQGLDLDHPERGRVPNFDLFLRLMDEPRSRGELYGELSAVVFRNREQRVLRTLLERTDLHARLVNGSDYPLPAIHVLVSTGRLEQQGFLTHAEREAVDEVYDYDPLLFDLVLKRTLRGSKGERFADEVFLARSWASRVR
jgi:predicted TIM-barrel fold metal-dependent hydrolase